MDDDALTIGQLARRFGLNTSAIRYYEAHDVLPEPLRVGGQRRYGPDAVRRLEVIAVAKRAGLSLDEIRALLRGDDAGRPAHESLRAIAAHRLPAVENEIKRAETMREWLTVAANCTCETLDSCAQFQPSLAR
jgi:MerR family transcriptional regulator, redox-sensitive transcriptional activator SoxR